MPLRKCFIFRSTRVQIAFLIVEDLKMRKR